MAHMPREFTVSSEKKIGQLERAPMSPGTRRNLLGMFLGARVPAGTWTPLKVAPPEQKFRRNLSFEEKNRITWGLQSRNNLWREIATLTSFYLQK